jgi:hypothetical protein
MPEIVNIPISNDIPTSSTTTPATSAMTTPAWLPDKRYYEYLNHKIRTPGVEWDTWRPWDEWTYPDEVIVWLSHLIE